MRNFARTLLNVFAILLFAFAIYINFIYKDKDDSFQFQKKESYAHSTSATEQPITVQDTNASIINGN